jgi:hypothetical protein
MCRRIFGSVIIVQASAAPENIKKVKFLATDPEARVRFPALLKKKSSGSGTRSTQPREYN